MKEDRHRVSVIIPNYNGRNHLERLLPNIADQTFDDYEVIIIDDCSPDRQAVEYIKTFISEHKNMRLIENSRNMGFAKTCNKGFALADAEYVCILTNDTRVQNTFIQRNVEILDSDSSIGVLSCIVADQHGKNWFCGGSFRRGFLHNLQDDFQGVRIVDWAAGTACFYRKQLLDKVGLLDEAFTMYHEDVEFCLRVKLQTDFKVCVFGEKLATHHLQYLDPSPPGNLAKRNRLYYFGHRNHLLILKRYYPGYLPKILLYFLWEIVSSPLISVIKLKPRALLYSLYFDTKIVKGIVSGLLSK